MTDEFKIIRGDVSPTEAIALLVGSPYGVVENTSQQAIGVVKGAELERAIAQGNSNLMQDFITTPILQVGQNVEMQAVVSSPLLTKLVQTNGLVTNNSDDIVGVLTKAEIQRFLKSGQSHQKGVTLGSDISNLVGERLAGNFRPLMAYYICRECRYRNALNELEMQIITASSPPSLPCQNLNPAVQPHALKLS